MLGLSLDRMADKSQVPRDAIARIEGGDFLGYPSKGRSRYAMRSMMQAS